MFRIEPLLRCACCSLIFAASAIGQQPASPDQQVKTKEFNQKWEAAKKAKAASDFAAAIEAGRETLDLQIELIGKDHQDLISTFVFLAECEEAREDWPAAKAMRTEILNRTNNAFGPTDYRATNAKLALDRLDILERLSPEQRTTLVEVKADDNRITELNRNREYAAAIQLAQKNIQLKETLLGRDHPETAVSLDDLAVSYYWVGNNAAAEPLYLRALKIREDALGPEHPETASSLNNLAVLYKSQGKHTVAEPLLQRALKINEKILGPDHAETATCLNNLADFYRSQANYDAAEPLHLRALKIREKIFGPDHPEITSSLHNLAFLYNSQGKYTVAEPLLRRALKITETALGPDDPSTAISLNNLAGSYVFQGNYPAAEALYQRALKIREKAFGPDHPETAFSLHNLATLYETQGKHAAAERLYMRALTIYDKTVGPDHPETARSLNNLALLYKSQGRYTAAERPLQRALKIYEKTVGPDHPDTAASVHQLAMLYYAQGNYAAAEPLYQRALTIREKSLGLDHPDTATTLTELAELYRSQANYAAAEPLFQRALTIREKALGPEHPDTGTSLNNLALLYHSQGNYVAAGPLYLRALKISEKTLGPEHSDVATNINNLAGLYQSQANYAAAEPLFRRALEITEKALGPDHPSTALSLTNLAGLYNSQANYVEAEPLYQRALTIRENALGPDHPKTASSLTNLASVYSSQANDAAAEPLVMRAIDIVLRHLEQTSVIQSEQQQLLFAAKEKQTLYSWLNVTSQNSDASTAWDRSLPWKGLTTSRQSALRKSLGHDPLFAEYRRATQQLSLVTLSPPLPPSNPSQISAWREREREVRRLWLAEKQRLEVIHTELEKQLAQKSSLFSQIQKQQQVTSKDIAASFRQQERPTALVDFVVYLYFGHDGRGGRTKELPEFRIAAFVARSDRDVQRVELGAAPPILNLVGVWRRTLGQADAGRRAAKQLRYLLWQPLEAKLDGIEIVLISPDGALSQFPWNALPGSKEGSFLIEERSIAMIPIPRFLPELLQHDRTEEPPASLLLAGDIDYSEAASAPRDLLLAGSAIGRRERNGELRSFAALNGAMPELRAIHQRFGQVCPDATCVELTKGSATEDAFRQAAEQHPWLHIVTHGFFAPDAIKTTLQSAPAESSAASVPALGGVGVGLKQADDGFVVTALVAAGAAQVDGRLRVGDTILAVAPLGGEWTTTAGKTLEEVIPVIRGTVGTEVRLKVRPQADPQTDVEIRLFRRGLPNPDPKNSKPIFVHPGLLSGLAFAGANNVPEPGKDDGILTALEVTALDLRNVDMVVLSACETGLGEVAGGEGLLGLQRAFQVAGAKTCVASLWSVHDAGTRVLMERFYDNLWQKKLGKLEALREAQLWVLRNPKEFYAKFTEDERLADAKHRGLDISSLSEPGDTDKTPPYYWAAFVLSGDWR